MHKSGESRFLSQSEIVTDQEGHPTDDRIRRFQTFACPDKGTQRGGRDTEQSFVGEEIFERFPNDARPPAFDVVSERQRFWNRPFHAGRIVITKLLADTLELVQDVDPEFLQAFRLADA